MLFSGNRETLRMALFDRDSILWWVLRTYRHRRREYPRLFALPEHRHLKITELRTPQQADRWLADLKAPEAFL